MRELPACLGTLEQPDEHAEEVGDVGIAPCLRDRKWRERFEFDMDLLIPWCMPGGMTVTFQPRQHTGIFRRRDVRDRELAPALARSNLRNAKSSLCIGVNIVSTPMVLS